MNDMVAVTAPKSDQWNFDDFQAEVRTFKITGVKVRPGTEQPVDVLLEGTEKFYRPCKSMMRCMVAVWGADSSKYVGKSFTLYGDPKVRWGGMEVGGLRISHMSDLSEPLTMALTATKGSRKPFTVRPLVVEPAIDWKALLQAANTLDELGAAWNKLPKSEKDALAGFKDARKIALTANSGQG